MGIIAKDKAGGYAPISAGMHHAICYGVVDLGTHANLNPNFPPRRKVLFIWEVPSETITIDGKALPRAVSAQYTLSLNPKGNLRPMLESWRGRTFSELELDGFDLQTVIGANCFLNIVHANKDGKTFANVKSVSPLAKGMPKLTAVNKTLYFSLDDCQGEIVFPENMPEWIKGKIAVSDEFLHRKGDGGVAVSDDVSANVDSSVNPDDVPF